MSSASMTVHLGASSLTSETATVSSLLTVPPLPSLTATITL